MRPLRRRLVRPLCQRLAKRHRPVERRGRSAAVASRVPCDSCAAQELPPTRSWAAGRLARWCFTAAARTVTWLFAPMNPASSSPPTCQRRARCAPRPLCAAACFGSGAAGRPCCCRRTRQGLGPHTARLHRRVRAATAPSLPRAVVTRLSSVTRRPRSQVLPECRCSGQTAQQLSSQRRRCCPRAPCAASSLHGVLERLVVEIGVVRGLPPASPLQLPTVPNRSKWPQCACKRCTPVGFEAQIPRNSLLSAIRHCGMSSSAACGRRWPICWQCN
jgi:hypothetical protein